MFMKNFFNINNCLKMYCIVSENGEEVNTAKEVNISTEFKEYKNVLFKKKINKTQNEKNSKQTTYNWYI